MFNSQKRIARTILVCSALTLSVLMAYLMLWRAHNSAAKLNEPMPGLQGQPAIDYLKQHGLFESAKAAVEADRHEIKWLPEAGGCGARFDAAPGSPVAESEPFSVALGDFNLDGKPDLATANFFSDNVTILLGNGSGGFTQPAGSPIGVGTNPRPVAVGDFNLDGKPDLTIANYGSANVTILLGDGSGGFTQPAGSPVGARAQSISVAVADFNLDGKPDLAVANYTSNNVTILLGNGTGGFAQPAGSPVSVGSAPYSVAVGDFNLDSKPDLATGNQNSNNVTILLGNGSGGFTQPAGSPVGAGSNPLTVAVGDLNLDGKPDLTVTNYGSANVTILLGNGSGGFMQAAGSPVGVGTNPQSVAVGDFNLDGKPDLATANFHSDNVTILLGNGSGGFSSATGSPVGVGNAPASVAVGDFNGDGKQDLAVATANSIPILLGNGGGAFSLAPGSSSGIASQLFSVAVADLNGDGKQDLAVANVSSNNVTILLNN